jgi:hypothetical protein
MRLATTLASLGLLAALLLGCGGGGGGGETAITTPGQPGKPAATPHLTSTAKIRASWISSPDCSHPAGASRWACSVGPYRCQAVASGRGWSVDCAKPGRSIGFTVPARK